MSDVLQSSSPVPVTAGKTRTPSTTSAFYHHILKACCGDSGFLWRYAIHKTRLPNLRRLVESRADISFEQMRDLLPALHLNVNVLKRTHDLSGQPIIDDAQAIPAFCVHGDPLVGRRLARWLAGPHALDPAAALTALFPALFHRDEAAEVLAGTRPMPYLALPLLADFLQRCGCLPRLAAARDLLHPVASARVELGYPLPPTDLLAEWQRQLPAPPPAKSKVRSGLSAAARSSPPLDPVARIVAEAEVSRASRERLARMIGQAVAIPHGRKKHLHEALVALGALSGGQSRTSRLLAGDERWTEARLSACLTFIGQTPEQALTLWHQSQATLLAGNLLPPEVAAWPAEHQAGLQRLIKGLDSLSPADRHEYLESQADKLMSPGGNP
jgi:hypothetical protein